VRRAHGRGRVRAEQVAGSGPGRSTSAASLLDLHQEAIECSLERRRQVGSLRSERGGLREGNHAIDRQRRTRRAFRPIGGQDYRPRRCPMKTTDADICRQRRVRRLSTTPARSLQTQLIRICSWHAASEPAAGPVR
jgi:hypothetical protein